MFVSSTYADLKDERKKVIQTLLELDCIPAGMELFPATDEEQFEFIKRIIDDCDYYLLIIGGRYGSVTADGISYTELEYEYALERKLKVIALLHENPEQIASGKSEKDPELCRRLQFFRDKVATGRLVKFWSTAEALPGIVALSLSKMIKTYPAVGWVRADKVSSEELLIEINELHKQNRELNKALSEIESSIFTGSEEKDFAYIYSQLNRFEGIEVSISRQGNFEVEKYSINLASLIPFISTAGNHEYDWDIISRIIRSGTHPGDNVAYFAASKLENMPDELTMYGFLTKKAYGNNEVMYGEYRLIYSEKLERYKYWLQVNGKMPEHIEFSKNEQ